MISTCIITHQLNRKLARAIDSVRGLGEVVLVDTRGDPRQSERVNFTSYHTYPWHDDFSAARNFALEKAKFPTIFSLDSDEWIDGVGWDVISDLPVGNAYLTRLIDVKSGYLLDQLKIFPNRSDVKFLGRVHEQIAPAVMKAHIPIIPTTINVYHDGYIDPEELRKKQERNRKISAEWLQQEPQNRWARFWYDYIRQRQ